MAIAVVFLGTAFAFIWGKCMRAISIVILTFIFGMQSAPAAELLMFESAGCEWCEIWDEEVGIIYPKTSEARAAPLRRLDIDTPREGKLSGLRPVMFTPTFILMDKGKEVGRILGYPGESNFWGLLDEMIARLPDDISACSKTTRKLAQVSTTSEGLRC